MQSLTLAWNNKTKILLQNRIILKSKLFEIIYLKKI